MAISKQTHTGSFHFDPNDPIYKDHFPGRPVVPGSLIVHAFITAATSLENTFRSIKVERFRFKRFVTPGTYTYRLDLCGENQDASVWRCSLSDGDREVVCGVLK